MTKNDEKIARLRPGPPKGAGAQRVYDVLSERILRLELAPGAFIVESAVVSELGVSRTPVREALTRLASEGLIEISPNQGARVASLDVSQISEILEALELIQRAVCRWAAICRTPEDLRSIGDIHDEFLQAARDLDYDRLVELNRAFHRAIGKACGNSAIAKFYDTLLGDTLRLARMILARRLSHLPSEHRYDVVIAEHDAILAAIESKNAERADELGAKHAELFRKSVVSFLSNNKTLGIKIGDPRGPLGVA